MTITPQNLQSQYLPWDTSNTQKNCVKIQGTPGSAGSYSLWSEKKKKKEAKQNIEFETPERGLFVNTYFNTCKCYTKKEAKMHLMILKLTLLLQED